MSKTGKDDQGRSGFTCECGTFHIFGGYVAAHWTESLVHTCDKCQAEHEVRRGKATLREAIDDLQRRRYAARDR